MKLLERPVALVDGIEDVDRLVAVESPHRGQVHAADAGLQGAVVGTTLALDLTTLESREALFLEDIGGAPHDLRVSPGGELELDGVDLLAAKQDNLHATRDPADGTVSFGNRVSQVYDGSGSGTCVSSYYYSSTPAQRHVVYGSRDYWVTDISSSRFTAWYVIGFQGVALYIPPNSLDLQVGGAVFSSSDQCLKSKRELASVAECKRLVDNVDAFTYPEGSGCPWMINFYTLS